MRRAQVKDRLIGSGKISSIVGLVGSAAVTGAAEYYKASGGNVGSWQPYALAAGVAVAGLVFKRPVVGDRE